MSAKEEKVIRPVVNFHPSVWADQLLIFDDEVHKLIIKTQ